MLTLNISEADIERAKYERIDHPLASVRKRMDVLYWTSQGNSRSKVSDISGVHRNSIVKYIKLYNEGGLDQLLSFRYKGPESKLSGHRITLEAVKAWAIALGVELVFLPPYSPNLNLIERLWKYIKKDIIGNQYFESAHIFRSGHCPSHVRH